MLFWATAIWVLGLLTLVPYGTYYLFFEAQRDEYALLITLVLFWIFGFWGLIGPLLSAIKIRTVFRAIERAQSREQLLASLQSEQTRQAAIDMLASENHIPRFLAEKIYHLLIKHFAEKQTVSTNADQSSKHER